MYLRISLLATMAVIAVPVSGAQAAGTFDCRASAVRVTAPPVNSEPIVANAPSKPCSNQNAATVAPTTVGPVAANALSAATAINSEGVGATASAAGVVVSLPGLVVETKTVQAAAGQGCSSAAGGTSIVEDLIVNGQTISIPAGQAQTTIPLGPIQIVLNESTQVGDFFVRRAVHVVTPIADVVLAEAIVGRSGSPCVPATTVTPPATTPKTDGGGTGNNNGSGFPNPCPRGSTYEPSRNLCVIREGSGSTSTTIVVGRPYAGPSGGTVYSLEQARKRSNSPCLRGKGPKFAVLGTKGRDEITGSNTADRIVLLAGRDHAEGGRGDDCMDGGTGVDTLSGALGKDHLIGGTGGDHLIGGSAADRLIAGPGNDSINAGFGKDYVSAGSGNDKINVATAGFAVVKLSCGTGRDTVRFNRNEKRRAARGRCEKRYMIR